MMSEQPGNATPGTVASNGVKVVELTAFHVLIPLRKPFRHASHTRSSTDNIVVRCVLDDGTEGFGEGVPREYVTGETIEGSFEVLCRTDWAGQLEPCRDFAQATALAERLRLAPVAGDERGCMAHAARCAVELSLLDAWGRRFGESLSSVTRLLAPDLWQPRSRVRYSGAISSAQGLKLHLKSLLLRWYRFRHVKVKVGIAGLDDVSRLRVIRRYLNPRQVALRIDANEAWSAEDVVQRCRELEPFAISAIEQPLPHSADAMLPEIRRQIDIPIMLDESLCSPRDAEQAIANRACDWFNLRLSKCGGFIPSLRLAQLARRHGLRYQLGCQVGETAILSAAGRHFAASVAELQAVEGSYDRHLVREALGRQDLTFGFGGWASALTGPGLGLELDPVALQRVTVRQETLLG